MQDGPLALRAFLDQFPKGADLHVHLSGAVYAETFIRDAGEDELCVDPAALSFPRKALPCTPPLTPAAQLPANQALYDRLIDAFSMRGFVPTSGFSGHDQFFATFDRFGGLSKKHIGEWVDEVASRAAAQNQQYVELMETPIFSHAAEMASQNPLESRTLPSTGRRCSPWRCAMRSSWTARMCAPPRRCGARSSTAALRRPRPPAG